MILQRAIKPTLTPFELNPGDQLALTLGDGRLWEMKLLGATAAVVARGFDRYRDDGHAGSDITVYAFEATVLINGNEHRMRREVGSQRAFYEPWIVDGDGLRQGHAGRRCHRHAQGTGFRSGHGGAIARGRRRLARG